MASCLRRRLAGLPGAALDARRGAPLALASALAALPATPGERRLPRFGFRRAQAVLLLVVALLCLALGALTGALLWPGAGSAGASALASYPGPSFAPAANWTTVASGPQPAEPGAYAANAWATNVPLTSEPGPHGVFPFGGSELSTLPPDGILIVVWLGAPEQVPAPANVNYPDRDLPIQLSDAIVQPHWEGEPSAEIPQYC
jgi:hypothetical protein